VKLLWLKSTKDSTNEIGWLPGRAYEVRHDNGEIAHVTRNGDLVGWAMFTHSRHSGLLKIFQIWVRPDARILTHGAALVAYIEQLERWPPPALTQAWVAEDIPATLFWQALGFTRRTWKWGRGENPRRLNLWQRRCHTTPGTILHERAK
jgi:GNAT superfamily N-acetyltransferase